MDRERFREGVRRLGVVAGAASASLALWTLVARSGGIRDLMRDAGVVLLAMAFAGGVGWGGVRVAAWVVAGFLYGANHARRGGSMEDRDL